ncbi:MULTISPECIES: MotA/TolQ/ExbB proton channel family protein [Veillonella]|uniref:MotA/TolQ/ExbB proton channel family protein n=1 Tax=Veillonella denticariosi JCM 15641 TaxID=1298594 RepID=A0A2S7Z8C2_9FIRM|nr:MULTISPECIES: MotA/TolQ/ExbB proton channel family protein [Veillonella]ETS93301.1 transporter, MotA/TolQ/ExbB proton channel family protein [Veillonella sp. AS16]PQL19503.1 MotA/TolQ/ExbB proton channel family protein [Veillonella denticariosi JCM 15641]
MENLNYVIHLFHSGGYVMYPLLFLSLMVIAIAVERAFYYRKYAGKTFVVCHAVNELSRLQRWDEIEKVIQENPSIASRVAQAGLMNDKDEAGMKTAFGDQMGVDAVGFKKYMDYLSATVTISPLLGLLGTVTGMIGSFSILDSGAGASAITGGVGEALIATASGLCVAIMAFIVYTFFSHRLDSIINQIETMCVNIITAKREGWK